MSRAPLSFDQHYILCICEGEWERATIDLLLDHHCLIFQRKQLIETNLANVPRKAKEVQRKFLNRDFDHPFILLRILDSRKDHFTLDKIYEHRDFQIINIYTRPEIEMLWILSENLQDDFQKSDQKPSDFCKKYLGRKDIKTRKFFEEYFTHETLLQAIRKYPKKEELCLWHLLQDSFKYDS